MMPLTMNASMISKAIREKKKKLLMSEPEMVGTSPTPDYNAQDIYDLEQKGRIEGTLMSPEKINADLTMLDEPYDGVGVSPVEKPRMERLRKYIAALDMWSSKDKMGMMR